MINNFKINITLFVFFVALYSNAQKQDSTLLNRSITIDITSGSGNEILEQMQKASKVIFSYTNKIILPNRIQLTSKKNTIQGFLNQIFYKSDVNYILRKNKIIITPKKQFQKHKFTISGFVKSRSKVLIGASVYDKLTLKGAASNNYGFYSITLPASNVSLNCSYIGYFTVNHTFHLNKDTVINFNMIYNTILDEIPIVEYRDKESISSSKTNYINLPAERVQKFPSFMGEPDAIRMIQMMPGVSSGNDGVSGINVRGGNSDQNLFLLDGIPVYNITHLLGSFSVFNTDALNTINITKGGFPARYGGRLSSVIDISLKGGDEKKINGNVSIGLLSTKASLNGPLIKNKTTFNISFRRSYIDAFLYPLQNKNDGINAYYFYDGAMRLSHKFSQRNKLHFNLLIGNDKLYNRYNYKEISKNIKEKLDKNKIKLYDESATEWQNLILSLRWNKVYNDKLFSNITAAITNYRYNTGVEQNEILDNNWNYFNQRYLSGITDWIVKADFDYFYNPNNHFRFGVNFTDHVFNPGADLTQRKISNKVIEESIFTKNKSYAKELFIYAEDDIDISNKIKANIGIHNSYFVAKSKMYSSFQPRLSMHYILNNQNAIKISYSKMAQYMRLVNANNSVATNNIWLPASENLKPQYSEQYTIGYKWLLINLGLDLSVDLYYKQYSNLLLYSTKVIYNELSSNNKKYNYGNGYSKGVEFFVNKKSGKFTGWVNYSLSENKQSFSNYNKGKYFSMNYDQTHSFSIYGNYEFNNRFQLSAIWVMHSGNIITLPTQKIMIPQLPTSIYNDNELIYYDDVNNYRMPLYHRLDVSAAFKKKIKIGERTWNIGVYNLYGHQNAYSLFFKDKQENINSKGSKELRQLSILPIPIPYIRYTLKF